MRLPYFLLPGFLIQPYNGFVLMLQGTNLDTSGFAQAGGSANPLGSALLPWNEPASPGGAAAFKKVLNSQGVDL